ncbi:MAG: DNA repair protein RadC, partial [Oscillospiraceae bacterium]|nr:DNA repair protein RadC [Oscillospiraceae bacterium]
MESVHKDHRNRRRQQFYDHGADAFADHELLELLLFYGIARKDVNALAHTLIHEFGSLDAVFSAPIEALESVDGIGRQTAVLLKLVPQLMRRAHLTSLKNDIPLDTVERIGDFFAELFVCESNEVMYQLCLDAKGRKLSCTKVAEGDPSSVSLNLRRIVQNALRCNAVMVAVAHNHPSGVAFPSHGDKIATQQIMDALRAVNVQLIDHIVVADNDYISFR